MRRKVKAEVGQLRQWRSDIVETRHASSGQAMADCIGRKFLITKIYYEAELNPGVLQRADYIYSDDYSHDGWNVVDVEAYSDVI